MLINKNNFEDVINASYLKQIYFTDKTSIYLSFDYFIIDYSGRSKQVKFEEALNYSLERIPLCMWCSNSREFNATIVMLDGLLLCDNCLNLAKKYYVCKICEKELLVSQATRARKDFQTITCGSNECIRAEDIRCGRLCCNLAENIPCVCTRSYKCPIHYPTGIHIGTHD